MIKLKNLIENSLFNSDKEKAIADYFTDMDIILSSKFKLKDVADTIGVPEEAAFTLLMNLEHEGLMITPHSILQNRDILTIAINK